MKQIIKIIATCICTAYLRALRGCPPILSCLTPYKPLITFIGNSMGKIITKAFMQHVIKYLGCN